MMLLPLILIEIYNVIKNDIIEYDVYNVYYITLDHIISYMVYVLTWQDEMNLLIHDEFV